MLMANQHEMNGTKNRGLDKRYLLNDEAMQDFIINGYLVVHLAYFLIFPLLGPWS